MNERILTALLSLAVLALAQGSPSNPAPAPRPQMESRPTAPTVSVPAKGPELRKMTLDFVETDIGEVLRNISAAYGLSVIADRDVTGKVSVHLNDVEVMEGLEALCSAYGFEVLQENGIYRVRKASEKTRNIVRMNFERMDLDVENQDIKAFIRDFASKTGLKILASNDLTGTVSGSWKNQLPLDGFKALMDAHGYKISYKNGFYIVRKDDSPSGSPGNQRARSTGQGAMDIEVKDGLVTLNLTSADLQEVLRNIAEQARLNIVFYGEARENLNASLDGVPIETAIATILKGSRFTYTLTADKTLLVAEKGARSALSANVLVPLSHIKSADALGLIPKSLLAGGLQVTDVKEQNSILLTGALSEISDVQEFLALVDVPTLQVVMECIIVEFNRGNDKEYGIKPGQGTGLQGFVEIPGQDRKIDIRGSTASIGVLDDRFRFALNAMENSNQGQVLARPSISTLNGNKAVINVTNTSYYKVTSVSSEGQPIVDYRPFNDGISLEITPSVTQSGEITIDIAPDIKTTAQSTTVDAPGTVSSRNLRTVVKLKDGQTVRLGGLIRSSKDKVREHIPVLGSIPILGWLFSYHTQREVTTELVLYITPHILREPSEGSADLGKDVERMKKLGDHDDVVEDLVRDATRSSSSASSSSSSETVSPESSTSRASSSSSSVSPKQ